MDPSSLPALFRTLSLGVYVVGVGRLPEVNAFTAAWLMPVSFSPPLLALAIGPHHASHALLQRHGVFTVNVLAAGQAGLAERFGRPGQKDFASVNWQYGRTGAPILPEALAHMECWLEGSYPAGDHRLALGTVVHGAIHRPTALLVATALSPQPLLYASLGDLDGAAALFPPDFPPYAPPYGGVAPGPA